jgi:hypothetical protein
MATANTLTGYFTGLLERQRRENFAGVRGAAVSAAVPLREGFVNDLLQEFVVTRQADRVRLLRVAFLDNNIVHVKATVKVLFAWPTVDIAAQIENRVSATGAPVLRLQIVPLSGGLLETFLPALLSLLPFPESVTVSGRQVDVNIHTAFTRRGLNEIAALIHRAEVHSRRGVLLVGLVLRAD